MQYRLDINDVTWQVDVPSDMPLLWILRDELGLIGTKYGCGKGLCGACTVHIDGSAQRSCQLPVASIGNAKIQTIEHIGATPIGARLQQAWLKIDVMQCGCLLSHPLLRRPRVEAHGTLHRVFHAECLQPHAPARARSERRSARVLSFWKQNGNCCESANSTRAAERRKLE